MEKPSVNEVHQFLYTHNALIVHFSGTPGGIPCPGRAFYPNDLQNVINGHAQTGLSCSIIMPSDDFNPSSQTRNVIGSIGLIIDLITPDSLMAVSAHDAGSEVIGGVRKFTEMDITPSDLNDSLKYRKTYNEWGLQNYRVCGILALPPYEYWNPSPPGFQELTNIPEIQNTFNTLPIYSFWDNKIIRFPDPVTAKDIYL